MAVSPFQGGQRSLFPLTQGCTRCARFALGWPVAAFQAGDRPTLRQITIDFPPFAGRD
jgi:hypothetical protein